MTTEIHGGCACGASRYTCSERPLVQLICHCRDCQRASGSAFAACLVFPTDRLQFHGKALKSYQVRAHSGRTMRRLFCAECAPKYESSTPARVLYAVRDSIINSRHVVCVQICSTGANRLPTAWTPWSTSAATTATHRATTASRDPPPPRAAPHGAAASRRSVVRTPTTVP